MFTIYTSGGRQQMPLEEVQDYIVSQGIMPAPGKITSLEILHRQKFSNKGHALSGMVELCYGYSVGLNIGGNPIGTGYENYIPFLEHMMCKKNLIGLYNVQSLVGADLYVLEDPIVPVFQRISKGIVVPTNLLEAVSLVK